MRTPEEDRRVCPVANERKREADTAGCRRGCGDGARLRLGRGAALVTELTDLVAANPLRERLVAALMRSLVAAGRDAATTPVRDIAEPPRYTLDPELPLDEAFRFLEDHDLARVPVTEDDRLVGVLSRSSLQRRLAEDEPPRLDEDPGTAY